MKYKIRDNKDQLAFSFRKRLWRNNSILLILTFLILLFSIRAAWRVYLNDQESQQASLEKQNELAKLEERQKFLAIELKKLQTPEGREAKLREKFGVGSPGENVAIIVEAEDKGDQVASSTVWQDIKSFFKGIFE